MFTDKTMEVIEPQSRVRVRHVGPAATATFEYAFEGEDVRIKARVENFTDKAIKATSFEGLSFLFDSAPKGWMVGQDPGWMKAHVEGFRGFHPSFENRIGGSYAADETFGVGLTPLNTGLAYTGFFWWGDKAGPNARRLVYIRPQEIPSGGALTFEMLMRISPNKRLETPAGSLQAALRQDLRAPDTGVGTLQGRFPPDGLDVDRGHPQHHQGQPVRVPRRVTARGPA